MSATPRKPASPAWGHGRGLLLNAARDLFTRQGYDATTTREIAEAAGVSEQMVFRHFGSKAQLFEIAAVAPFIEHLDQYASDWAERPPGVRDPVAEATDLYRGLYTVFSANRALMSALLTVEADSQKAPSDAVGAALSPALERFSDLLRIEQNKRGFRDFDTAIVVRLVAGLALSQALFADFMYSDSHTPPSVDAVIHEMAMLTIYGAWPPAHN